jgi:hypothetical protein
LSIKGALREMKLLLGRVGGARHDNKDGRLHEIAAVWIVEPKSLGERMRSDITPE